MPLLHSHSHTHSLTHTLTLSHTHSLSLSHTLTLSRTHTLTHSHTHTRAEEPYDPMKEVDERALSAVMDAGFDLNASIRALLACQ